jgi:transposase
MDNGLFHKSETTQKLIESVGCIIIFLPPYSPDLNPIEKFWANMKKWIKQQIESYNGLYQAISAFLNAL